MFMSIVELLAAILLIARTLYLGYRVSFQLIDKVLGEKYGDMGNQLCLHAHKKLSATWQEMTRLSDAVLTGPPTSNRKEGTSDIEKALIPSGHCPKCRGERLLQSTNLQLREDPPYKVPGTPIGPSLAARPVVALECTECGYCELYTTDLPLSITCLRENITNCATHRRRKVWL